MRQTFCPYRHGGCTAISWINERVKTIILMLVFSIPLTFSSPWPHFLSVLLWSLSARQAGLFAVLQACFTSGLLHLLIPMPEMLFPRRCSLMTLEHSPPPGFSCFPLYSAFFHRTNHCLTLHNYQFVTSYPYQDVSSTKAGALFCFLLFHQHLELCLAHNSVSWTFVVEGRVSLLVPQVEGMHSCMLPRNKIEVKNHNGLLWWLRQ